MTRWILFVALLFMAAPSWATTYYVSPGGHSDTPSDANSCTTARTITTPKATVGSGVGCLIAAGDILLVRGGTTTETSITINHSGSAGNPITIKNYPGESPVLHWANQGDSFQQNRMYISLGTPWTTPISDITIQGLEFDHPSECVKLEATLRFTFTGNNCHDAYYNGITATETGGNKDATITNNIFANNGRNAVSGTQCGGVSTCNQFHGMYILGQNWTITNNLIYGNLAYGIQTDAKVPSPTPDAAAYGGFSGLIANNTIAYELNGAGIIVWRGNGTLSNLTIENNILYENSQNVSGNAQAFYFQSCGSSCSVTVRNNLWYGTGNSANMTCISGVGCGASVPSGVTITNTTNASPAFVNGPATQPGVPDYHLNNGSPAIAAGFDLTGTVTTDFYSTLRSAPYDIGAVKYTVIGGGGGGGSNNFTQVATDTFNRAAEDPLNASNWVLNSAAGHQFIIPATNPTVAQPKTFSSGDASMTWVGSGTFTNDQYGQTVLGPVATTGGDNTIGYGPSVRSSTSAGVKTEYALVASHSGWELRRDVAGTYLSLANSTTTTFNQGDSITVAVYGSSPPTFVLQKNSTDIDLTSATRCGSCGASGPITDGNASAITTGAPGIFYSSTESGGTDHGIDIWFGGNYLNGADVTAPSVPTGLTVTANLPNQLLVSWTASTDNVAVTSYTVQACALHSCTNFATLATPTGVSYTYTGLANNTVYAVQVRANDAAGNSSAYATAVEATTLPSTQVPVISNPIPTGSAVVDASPITISVNTDIPAVCKYNTRTEGTAAYASLAHTMTANALVNSASVTPDQHASNSGVNHFYIACDNAASTGHASATTDMTFTMIAPGDATRPSTISNLTAIALDAVRIQLNWTAATDNTAVTGYNIYCSTGIGTPIVTFNTDPITATPILVVGAVATSAVLTLTLGTVYNFVITGFDAAGNIALDSNVAVSQTFSALSAPTNVHLVGAPSNNIIELVWDPSTDVSAVGYHIYQSTVSGSLGSLVGTNTQATAAATHSSVTQFRTVIGAGGTYYYTIKSINAVGQEGAASAQLAVVRTGSVARTLRTP